MLRVVPINQRQAKAFIARHHRHHKPPAGSIYQLGVADGARLVGVAMIGRPIARAFDTGYILEVNRTCTDETRNANSMLYGAANRARKALGYRGLITYTQDGETGASLKAAGWTRVGERAARGNWAESSKALRHLRDDTAMSQVLRYLWQAPGTDWSPAPALELPAISVADGLFDLDDIREEGVSHV